MNAALCIKYEEYCGSSSESVIYIFYALHNTVLLVKCRFRPHHLSNLPVGWGEAIFSLIFNESSVAADTMPRDVRTCDVSFLMSTASIIFHRHFHLRDIPISLPACFAILLHLFTRSSYSRRFCNAKEKSF